MAVARYAKGMQVLIDAEQERMGRTKYYPAPPLSWGMLDSFLGSAESRKLQHNTTAERLEYGDIGIRYHDTVIFKIQQDGTRVLTHGGWVTSTTRDRLALYAPDIPMHWYIPRTADKPAFGTVVYAPNRYDLTGEVTVSPQGGYYGVLYEDEDEG